jgi:hypothetical protein
MRLRFSGPRGLAGSALLRLYPRSWRRRYESEVRALLESRPPGTRDAVDLLRGALDAHLHPAEPSWIPPLAALSGGALWTAAALVLVAQPVPADWPGYIVEVVPLALTGVILLSVAVVGAWLRIGDGGGGGFDGLAIDVALVGYLAWVVALAGILLHIDYVASIAVGMMASVVGTLLVACALARVREWPLAGALAAGSMGLLLASAGLWPVTAGWLAFGLGWTAAGLIELAGAARPFLPSDSAQG